jgi:hypothetical protein
MTRLESTKRINNLKLNAIKKGGYTGRNLNRIISACEIHKAEFGIDLTPNQFTK